MNAHIEDLTASWDFLLLPGWQFVNGDSLAEGFGVLDELLDAGLGEVGVEEGGVAVILHS
jgi:hypothetical protein